MDFIYGIITGTVVGSVTYGRHIANVATYLDLYKPSSILPDNPMYAHVALIAWDKNLVYWDGRYVYDTTSYQGPTFLDTADKRVLTLNQGRRMRIAPKYLLKEYIACGCIPTRIKLIWSNKNIRRPTPLDMVEFLLSKGHLTRLV